MGQRRRSREVALQILFEMEMAGHAPEEAIGLYYQLFDDGDEPGVPFDVRPFAEEIVRGVNLHRVEIDGMIGSASEHWRVARMSVVDRNILRIAIFEMLYCPDIPPKVSINEAIDLGKAFGNMESGAFINGILDHILPKLGLTAQAPNSSDPE